MKIRAKIIGILKKKGATSVDDLTKELSISRQYAHKLVKDLVDTEEILKIGTAPHVYYSLKQANENLDEKDSIISYKEEAFLNNHFMLVDALGNRLSGLKAMQYWCENQNLPLNKTISEFIETRKIPGFLQW